MVNMIECASIYLNNQKAEYARILSVSDAVHSVRSLYKLLSSYREREMYSDTVKHLDGALCIMPEYR